MNSKPAITPIPADSRLTALPIGRMAVWETYLRQTSMVWWPHEISFANDRAGFNQLNVNEKKFVKQIIAFFAALDKLVVNNIAERFRQDFPIFEVEMVYNFITVIENTHSITYSNQLNALIAEPEEQQRLIDAVSNHEVISKMGRWITETIDSAETAGERLLRMVCTEGIFFMGAFAAIYWIDQCYPGKIPGLVKSNEFIARDESEHVRFGIQLYHMLTPEHKVSAAKVRQIFDDSLKIADEFINDAIPVGLVGINSKVMSEYLRYHAGLILELLGHEGYGLRDNPLPFMKKTEMSNLSSFFESKPSEYTSFSTADTGSYTLNV